MALGRGLFKTEEGWAGDSFSLKLKGVEWGSVGEVTVGRLLWTTDKFMSRFLFSIVEFKLLLSVF